jgi:hypothetical protein
MAEGTTDALVLSYGRQIGLNTETAAPPTNAYIAADDRLQVFIATSGITQSVIVLARILLPDGTIVPNQWVYFPQNQRVGQSFYQDLVEGFLLSLTVSSVNSVAMGQTFVRVSLIRGTAAVNAMSQILVSGYVTTMNALSWPPSLLWASTSGRGNIRSIVGTKPAVAAPISETVPAKAVWRLMAFRFDLYPGAEVASRTPLMVISDGANALIFIQTVNGIPAGQATSFSFGAGMGNEVATVGVTSMPLPNDVYLGPGFNINVQSHLVQPTDYFDHIFYLVEEWLLQ